MLNLRHILRILGLLAVLMILIVAMLQPRAYPQVGYGSRNVLLVYSAEGEVLWSIESMPDAQSGVEGGSQIYWFVWGPGEDMAVTQVWSNATSRQVNTEVVLYRRNVRLCSLGPYEGLFSLFRGLSWSPDGSLIAASLTAFQPNITGGHAPRGRVVILTPSCREVWSLDIEGYGMPVWSPDGSRLAIAVINVGLSEPGSWEHAFSSLYILDRDGRLLWSSPKVNSTIMGVWWGAGGEVIAMGVTALSSHKRTVGFGGIYVFDVEGRLLFNRTFPGYTPFSIYVGSNGLISVALANVTRGVGRVVSFDMSCEVVWSREFDEPVFYVGWIDGGDTLLTLSSSRIYGLSQSGDVVWMGETPSYLIIGDASWNPEKGLLAYIGFPNNTSGGTSLVVVDKFGNRVWGLEGSDFLMWMHAAWSWDGSKLAVLGIVVETTYGGKPWVVIKPESKITQVGGRWALDLRVKNLGSRTGSSRTIRIVKIVVGNEHIECNITIAPGEERRIVMFLNGEYEAGQSYLVTIFLEDGSSYTGAVWAIGNPSTTTQQAGGSPEENATEETTTSPQTTTTSPKPSRSPSSQPPEFPTWVFLAVGVAIAVVVVLGIALRKHSHTS